MSAQLIYKQYTVTATPTKLTDIFGLSEQYFFSNFVVRLRSGATGSLFWGSGTVTAVPANAGGEIKPGESASFDLVSQRTSSHNIYFVGTPGDVALFTAVS